MARLSASERTSLSDRAFAYVDSQGRRKLPIHDASHVRNALARFGRVQFEDDAARERARTRLLQAAKRYRIVPIGFIANELDGARRRAERPDLPTGFVTMLMTDIEGSTALVEQLGPSFGGLIDEVWGTLREVVTARSGCTVEARADEFFAVFEAPRSAVDAAVDVQRALRERAFVDGARVRVRIGVHSGYPTPTAGNYVGIDVNTTSRITALGHGGQIVVSANTRDAVRSTNSTGIGFFELGEHRLRGVREPVSLFQVTAKGLGRRFPALRT